MCLALRALAQTADDWGDLATQGTEAYNRGAYAESEKFHRAGLAIAEKLGPKDDRLAASLSNLLLIRLFQQTTRDCGQPSAGAIERSPAPRIRL